MDAAAVQFVRQRAGERCEYCGLPQEFSGLRFHIEHIVARQHGGSDESSNLALARCAASRTRPFICTTPDWLKLDDTVEFFNVIP